MDGGRILPKSAQLNWYLFDHTEPVFTAFWQFVRGYLKQQGIETGADLYDAKYNTISLAREGRLMLGQMCGMNFSRNVTRIPGYLGSFVLAEKGVPAGYYHSVIIASKKLENISIDDLPIHELRAAHSEKDSYSGRFALYQALGGSPTPCAFGRVSYTGAHRGTLAAISSGQADIGAIDCLTWHMLQFACPEQVAKVKIIGTSPPVPAPPLVSGLAENSEELAILKKAIKAAFREDKLSAGMKNIGISGYKTLSAGQYDIFKECVV